ncbi:2OG-Fe(II) oxygenase [Synechococcus phage S-T4]|jgi:hypothetical protein|uniref:Uncharacterized protein n=1 Tax=Synechococcus phage S-T4 TaxID=2268578 RepID=A0A385EH06_9CAUD|nr:2OG-Fe(II) oxygenase [Synechococcus phage S-T4]AXQ70555.1 hypothetical protein [Synechococcus phage S-T4]
MIENKIWKYSLKNHKHIKETLLKEIEDIDPNSLDKSTDEGSSIYKTDFFTRVNLPTKETPKYFSYYEDNITDFYDHLHKLYYIPSLRIDNFWFQQYVQNDYHDWHIHPWSSLSYVYYVELDDPAYVTEFFDTKTKKKYQPKAEEGDIIVFDSYLPHRAPKIKSSTRKTIISSNLSFNPCLDISEIKKYYA